MIIPSSMVRIVMPIFKVGCFFLGLQDSKNGAAKKKAKIESTPYFVSEVHDTLVVFATLDFKSPITCSNLQIQEEFLMRP